MKHLFTLLGLIAFLSIVSCTSEKANSQVAVQTVDQVVATQVVPGAERLQLYYPSLKGKRVGLVVNHTSIVDGVHLVDTLLSMGIDVKKIFTPEHGLRGKADAGAVVKDGKDSKTGLPIVSLYGKNKKPKAKDVEDIDVLVFDLQDVGVRFYTYISTLHYILESAGENGMKVIVLDRPNPNGYYIDGPIREESLTSFVGMHPVPVVYGMTIGEYAQMIVGENWLAGGVKPELEVIQINNYNHDTFYTLPIKPSPNLPNTLSILLYPSLCLFEGTTVSIGRGTQKQFQVVGHPDLRNTDYTFTPSPQSGAQNPKLNGKPCKGWDLTSTAKGTVIERGRLDLSHIIRVHKDLTSQGKDFFLKNNFFDKLAGTTQLREQLNQGMTEEDIRATWTEGLDSFKKVRAKYLLYV